MSVILDKLSQQANPYHPRSNLKKYFNFSSFLEIFNWKQSNRKRVSENRRKMKSKWSIEFNSLLPPTYNSIIEETFLYHHTWFKKSFQCTIGSFCNFCIDHVFSLLWILCKVPLIGFGAKIALDLCSIWRSKIGFFYELDWLTWLRFTLCR